MASSGSGGDTQTEMCSLCGNHFTSNELVIVEGNRICAGCKPKYLQLLQQRHPAQAVDLDLASQGKILVMKRGAVLPERCVKCNAPAQGLPFSKTLYWHNPLIYLCLLAGCIGILVYFAIALSVRESASISVGLCRVHKTKRRRNLRITCILGLVSCVLVFAAIPAESNEMGIIGGVLFLVTLVYGVVAVPVVAASKIEGQYVYLRGVCKEFLATLPVWKGVR
ncbi:hypothetical protein ACFLU6_12685 [Acidobacteriota bacterium]